MPKMRTKGGGDLYQPVTRRPDHVEIEGRMLEFWKKGRHFERLVERNRGGPKFKFNESVSFQVFTDTQEETDRYWNAIVSNGGEESMCSWCKDRFGLSWQIVPRVLMKAITDPDRDAARRAMEAMMTMRKIDIAAIEAARTGR